MTSGALREGLVPLPVGKIPGRVLGPLLAKHAPLDERVLVGPRIGEDAAVIDLGDRCLVAASDPVTFVTAELGWHALVVNANDVAVRGARPRWFLATCLLPARRTTEADVEELFAQLGTACRQLEVSLVGGHTEVTHGLDRPLVIGTMLGEVSRERLVTTGGARPGDLLLLTKGIPLEGAAIIARDRGPELRRRGVAEPVLAKALTFVQQLSVVREATVVAARVPVHAMHDPTEGGLATALWELAEAAGVGLAIEAERIPVLPEGRTLCAAFGLDPLGTIASGALLLTLAPAHAQAAQTILADEGIACAVIGRVLPPGAGVTLVSGGRAVELPRFDRDEIARLFA